MTIPYDPQCKDLARHFLGDLASQELVSDLASQIQRTVEEWIESRQLWTIQELQRGKRNAHDPA